jgi:hypothetical protein
VIVTLGVAVGADGVGGSSRPRQLADAGTGDAEIGCYAYEVVLDRSMVMLLAQLNVGDS